MNIGKLDRRIIFIEPIYEDGLSNADNIIGWKEIDETPEVWAQKIENSGRTLVQGERVTFSQTTSWIVRFRSDLNVRMRVVFDTKMYQFVNIAEAEKGRTRYLNLVTNFLDNEYYT